jgi:phosphoribosylglycinamide formyltransferase 1
MGRGPPCLAAALAALVDCGVPDPSAHRLAVLASGDGSNFEALVRAARAGALGGDIVVLLCDMPGARVLERARRLGIESVCPPCGRTRTRIEDEGSWVETLRAREVDALLLAGFMRRLHEPLLVAFPGRILNLHPALLPSFPGLDAIGQALAHGVRWTGCTVHVVDADVDAGPIVDQEAVPVRDDDTVDTLAARIHEAEHRLYPRAVRRWLTEPWRREGRRIVFDRAGVARG